jgi:hypothetical protein
MFLKIPLKVYFKSAIKEKRMVRYLKEVSANGPITTVGPVRPCLPTLSKSLE